jgi:hypothetical protein
MSPCLEGTSLPVHASIIAWGFLRPMTHTLRFSALALFVLGVAAQNREEKIVQALHANEHTLEGVLIDAGCRDRSLWNLKRPPEPQSAAVTPGGRGTRGAEASQSSGISVDSKTIGLERGDITAVMNPDSSARQSDPTCAIKANTRSYALLLRDGRLLDLDEGGNTYATAAVQASPQGKAMINGRGPGFKPRVTIVGWIQGDHVFADQVKLAQ